MALDRYLAKTGFGAQQTTQPLDARPATTTCSSRWTRTAARTARSTTRAHAHSFQTTLSKHRLLAGTVAAGVGVAATGAARLLKR